MGNDTFTLTPGSTVWPVGMARVGPDDLRRRPVDRHGQCDGRAVDAVAGGGRDGDRADPGLDIRRSAEGQTRRDVGEPRERGMVEGRGDAVGQATDISAIDPS